MAGKPAVELEGGPQLQRAFRKMDARLAMPDAHASAGEIVATTARRLVHRITGDLAGSIEAEPYTSGAGVTATAPYAGYEHFGVRSRNTEPHPFLFDAIAESRDDVVRRYATEVADSVRTFDREAPP